MGKHANRPADIPTTATYYTTSPPATPTISPTYSRGHRSPASSPDTSRSPRLVGRPPGGPSCTACHHGKRKCSFNVALTEVCADCAKRNVDCSGPRLGGRDAMHELVQDPVERRRIWPEYYERYAVDVGKTYVRGGK